MAIESLILENGKYELRRNPQVGSLTSKRYGNDWRDLTGDKLVNALMDEVLRLRLIERKCDALEDQLPGRGN